MPKERTFLDLADLIEKYDYFLFDCDGVFWHGDTVIENAFDALRMIQRHPGKEIFYITNNSSRLRSSVIDLKFKKLGGEDFMVKEDHIYTSGYATGQFLINTLMPKVISEKNPLPSVYVVGEQGLKDELKKAGVRVFNDRECNPEWVDNTDPSISSDEFSLMEVDPSVVAVIAGICYGFSYRILCQASLFI